MAGSRKLTKIENSNVVLTIVFAINLWVIGFYRGKVKKWPQIHPTIATPIEPYILIIQIAQEFNAFTLKNMGERIKELRN